MAGDTNRSGPMGLDAGEGMNVLLTCERRIAKWGTILGVYPVAVRTLEEMIRDLSPEAQRQVADLVRRLAESTKSGPKRKLDQRWAGALKRYRDQYTSLQLQQKALEWRGD
jgi:hypothetical protein